jgi:hypothetical protein
VNLTTHLHLVTRIGISGAIPPLHFILLSVAQLSIAVELHLYVSSSDYIAANGRMITDSSTGENADGADVAQLEDTRKSTKNNQSE